MTKEDLVGKKVVLKDGKETVITEVEGNEIKGFIIHTDAENKVKKLSNKHRIFNLYLASKCGGLTLVDETLNNEMKAFTEKEKELELKKKQKKEEARKAAIERELLERERKTDPITKSRAN